MAIDDIDESRERFEKHGIGKQWNLERRPDGRYGNVFTAFRWHDWQIAWQAAERDTRERIALEIKEMSKRWRGTAEDTANFIIKGIQGVNR